MPAHETPDFLRVVEAIEAAIDSGELPPGSRLPTAAQLAEQHGVSRATINNAIAVLRYNGRIVTRKGAHGATVAGESTDEE